MNTEQSYSDTRSYSHLTSIRAAIWYRQPGHDCRHLGPHKLGEIINDTISGEQSYKTIYVRTVHKKFATNCMKVHIHFATNYCMKVHKQFATNYCMKVLSNIPWILSINSSAKE